MRTSILILTAACVAIAQPPPGGGGGGGPMQQGDGIWLRNAYFGEAQTFDACGGHQPGNGQYHHHAAPSCLREQLSDNIERVREARTGPAFREKAAPWAHSPILGWAFDGYPIYGPYAYSGADGARGEVRRMRSGYRLRDIAERKTLPDWALPFHANAAKQLTAAQYGPAISATFPLGRYLEDYEHAAGHGDLDEFNGRFAATPEYPNGTYAYHVTIEEDGTPAFPYIFAGQFKGTVSGGSAQAVPAGAEEGVVDGVPLLTSWSTRNAGQDARVALGFDPSAGAKTIWPTDVPDGARVAGGVAAPVKADVQRIRYSESDVYVNANGLASYAMGPWFDALQPGGVFGSAPAAQSLQVRFPRNPAEAGARRNTGLGAQGIWVNGVAVYNGLDGASYGIAAGGDVGGGLVGLAALHVSSASLEKGPLAPGSLVTATPLFGLRFPDALESVTVKDASSAVFAAKVLSASAERIEYRMPAEAAIGYATMSITGGGQTLTANVNVRASYLGLFEDSGEFAAQPDGKQLRIAGSGLGDATDAAAALNGGAAEILKVESADGRDTFTIAVPAGLTGWAELVIRAGGRASNAVWVEIP